MFRSMLIIATKGDSDLTYTFFSVDAKVKEKFTSSFSKVWDWKANFVVIKKSLPMNAIEAESFTPWGFTTHWG